jgi:hypothetical protein
VHGARYKAYAVRFKDNGVRHKAQGLWRTEHGVDVDVEDLRIYVAGSISTSQHHSFQTFQLPSLPAFKLHSFCHLTSDHCPPVF